MGNNISHHLKRLNFWFRVHKMGMVPVRERNVEAKTWTSGWVDSRGDICNKYCNYNILHGNPQKRYYSLISNKKF